MECDYIKYLEIYQKHPVIDLEHIDADHKQKNEVREETV